MNIETIEVGILATNCYLVSASEKSPLVVIDPGADLEKIMAAIDGREVAAIIVTHRHFDHIMALPGLIEATGAPLLAGEHDVEALCDPAKNMSETWAHPASVDHVDVTLYDGDRIRIKDTGAVEVVRACDCDIQRDTPELIFSVINTPGHTIGSISLLTDGACFTGDTLFAEGSVGRHDLPTGSLPALKHSVKSRLYVLPDETRIYPGHGPASTIGAERKLSPFS